MNSNLTPRYFVIGVILTWAIYSLLPTYKYQKMTEPEKEELRTSGELYQIESRIIRQGLDLRGGMYMVLEADIPTLISNLADIRDDQLMEVIQTSKEKSSSSEIDFFDEFKRNSKISNLKLARYYHQYGASQNEIFDGLSEQADDAINRVLEILQNRIDQFGVSEPTIQKQGKHRIVVEIA